MNLTKKTNTKKRPSKGLISLFEHAADVLGDWADLWKKILDKGTKEDFTTEELQFMFRPYLKKRLTTSQIKYLYDPEYYKAKSKEQYAQREMANISQDYSNNVLKPEKSYEGEDLDLEPISDKKLVDLGIASLGEHNKSIRRIRNDKAARLMFKVLCNDKNLPDERAEDLINDFIKPTREFRLTVALELDELQSVHIHNVLHYAIEAAEDMIEQIEKADKK